MEFLKDLYFNNKTSFAGLVAFIITAIIILLIPLDSLLVNVVDFDIILIIDLIIILIIFLIWSYYRNRLPKKGNKIAILFSLSTENNKQQIRLEDDFIGGIKKYLAQKGLSDKLDILCVDKENTSRFNKYLDEYLWHNTGQFPRLAKKIGADLYLWGRLKERMDGENTYIVELQSLLKHQQVEHDIEKEISQNLTDVITTFEIKSNAEHYGFSFASNYYSVVIPYVIGMAMLVSNDSYIAYELHTSIRKDFHNVVAPIKKGKLSSGLDTMMLNELLNMGMTERIVNNDLDKCSKYILQAYNMSNKDYSTLISYSYNKFDIERKTGKAIKILDEARKYSKGDYTWQYNKAFIQIYCGFFDKGIANYKTAMNESFPLEENIINQSIEYCSKVINLEPDKMQLLYVQGILYYKLGNLPFALDKFVLFLESEYKTIPKIEIIESQCERYVSKLKTEMNLDG